MPMRIVPLLIACALLAAGCTSTLPDGGTGQRPPVETAAGTAAPAEPSGAGNSTGSEGTTAPVGAPGAGNSVRSEGATAPGEQQDPVDPWDPRPRPLAVALYDPAAVMAGRPDTAAVWRIRASPVNGVAVSPDRKAALVYPGDWGVPSFTPYLVDLATGDETPLPTSGENWFSFGGWLPDGRLMLVGRSLWLGGPAGEELRPVAEDTSAWTVEPSPDGRYVALWAPSASGAVSVVDLETGAVTTVEGPFRRGCQDCGLTLAWSPDGGLLAGTDHDHDAGPAPPRIRIVNPFTDEQIRTIEGLELSSWLPDGSLLAREKLSEVMLRVDGEGNVAATYAGFAIPSPDGRFLLRVHPDGPDEVATLVELETGLEASSRLPAYPRWTPDSHLLVVYDER